MATRFLLRISDAGFSAARQRYERQPDGDVLTGPAHRAAIGIRDHDAIADYAAAVKALLVAAGATVVQANGKHYLEIDQIVAAQWANR